MNQANFLASFPPIMFLGNGRKRWYNRRILSRCDMPKSVLEISKIDTSAWREKTDTQIANDLGVADHVISYWRKKLGIPAFKLEIYRDGLKRCCTCKQYLSPSEFGQHKGSSPDNLRPDCFKCRKESRARNRDRINASKRTSYAANPEPVRERNRLSRIRNDSFEATRLYSKRRHASFKAEYVALAGGRCQRCGYGEFTSGLDFHHVNGDEKTDHPASVIGSGNKERTYSELDKCALLCRNCHQALHAADWNAEFVKRDGLGWTTKQSS